MAELTLQPLLLRLLPSLLIFILLHTPICSSTPVRPSSSCFRSTRSWRRSLRDEGGGSRRGCRRCRVRSCLGLFGGGWRSGGGQGDYVKRAREKSMRSWKEERVELGALSRSFLPSLELNNSAPSPSRRSRWTHHLRAFSSCSRTILLLLHSCCDCLRVRCRSRCSSSSIPVGDHLGFVDSLLRNDAKESASSSLSSSG